MSSAGDLAATFLRHVPEGWTHSSIDTLDADLHARFVAGRAAWPDVAVEPASFVRHLAARSGLRLPPLARAGDLYLTCAALLGDGAAVRAIRELLRADAARAVSHRDSSPAFVDEVVQVLSVKLFLHAEGEPSPLADYGGRASLHAWLSTAAKRTALNLRRNKDDQSHDEVASSGEHALGGIASPELLLLKAKYKSEFEAAIRVAIAAIPVKQRTLLLLHLVQGVTLPQLAAMQNVSRATVARWLSSAREALHDGTRSELTSRLKVSKSELESLAALVRSQVEVSLPAIVGGATTP
ncbi:MAG: sigma-70 family RNA polymerase sigma factor [Polyangiales bacterium]